MDSTAILACFFVGLALVVLAALATAIKIVQEYERIVVFRLGRSIGERGPGLVLLIPFLERGFEVVCIVACP